MRFKPAVLFCIYLLSFITGASQQRSTGHFINVSGKKVYYEQSGNGAPLLIVEGGGIDKSVRDFDLVVPELSKKFRVIIADSPGQGLSEQPDSASYPLLTDFCEAFIENLKLDSVYIMGWSDGGIAGLLLAARNNQRVRKVIAVGANNGLAAIVPPRMDIKEIKPQSLETWGRNNEEAIKKYKLGDWKKMMSDFNLMWYQEEYFPDSLLRNIRIPVMIVLGDRDVIRIEHAVEMHRNIHNSALYIMPNTTHDVFRERPDWVVKIASEFFR